MPSKYSKSRPKTKSSIKSELDTNCNLTCSGFCRDFSISSSDIVALIRLFYTISCTNEIAFDPHFNYGFLTKSANYISRTIKNQWWWSNVCGSTEYDGNTCDKIKTTIKLYNCPIYKFSVGIINTKHIDELKQMRYDSYHNPPSDDEEQITIPHGGMCVGQFEQSYGLKFNVDWTQNYAKGNLYHGGECEREGYFMSYDKLDYSQNDERDHTIIMMVDFGENTLSYVYNGENYGESYAFKIEPNEKYRFMLSMNGNQEKNDINIRIQTDLS